MPRLRAIHISVYDLQVIDRRVARNAPDLANRLLPDCQMLMPHDRGSATATLVRYWPEYRKPMSANRLVAGISLADVQAAAKVESELRAPLIVTRFSGRLENVGIAKIDIPRPY